MKETAFLVSTARGGVVSEAALVAALQAGEISGSDGNGIVHCNPVGSYQAIRRAMTSPEGLPSPEL